MHNNIYSFLKDIFPICRSIMGDGNRLTLQKIRDNIPIDIFEIKTGTKAYDWEVPQEWNINDAWVKNENGEKIIDFKKNNLHVMGYSIPINKTVDREEFFNHLHSNPNKPNAIPYITSYYKRDWGFATEQNKRDELKGDRFEVFIDSTLSNGSMSIGELILKGKTQDEVLISTYICHPYMANNECSGISVSTFLAKWLSEINDRKYTYRFVFAPETIGAVFYINRNYNVLRNNVKHAFNLTCIGDDNGYSYMPSRTANTKTDQIVKYVFDKYIGQHKVYSFDKKGSDERQYCHPLVDLPMVSIMRTKYGEYYEYHTSLDNLDFVSEKGLESSLEIVKKCIETIEKNFVPLNTIICEPMFSKRNLRPTNWNRRESLGGDIRKKVSNITNVISCCDGKNDIIDISTHLNIDFLECCDLIEELVDNGILKEKKT